MIYKILGKILKNLPSGKKWLRAQQQGSTASDLWVDVGSRSNSGNTVTDKTSLTFSPVYAALNLISRDIAKLPLCVFKIGSGGSKTKNIIHPAFQILAKRPNEFMTPFQFVYRMCWQMLLYGNSYSWIRRSGPGGPPIDLIPIHPLNVEMIEGATIGEIAYRVTLDSDPTQDFILNRKDMFHLKNFGDGLSGFVTYELAKQAVGMGLATQEFVQKFFMNSARTNLVIMTPGEMEEDAKKNIRRGVIKHNAGLDNAWKPMILEEGVTLKEFGMSNEDAQLLSMLDFSIRDISNYWLIPDFKLAGNNKSSYNSLESETQAYLDQTLMGHLVNFEQESEHKLLTSKEIENDSSHIEFDRSKLTVPNLQDRGDFLSKAVTIGIMSRNEARQDLGLNPVTDLDCFLIPANEMVVGEEPSQEPEEDEGSLNKEEPSQDPSQEPEEDALEAASEIFTRAINGFLKRIKSQALRASKNPDTFMGWVEESLLPKNEANFLELLRPISRVIGGGANPRKLSRKIFDDLEFTLLNCCDCKRHELEARVKTELEKLIPSLTSNLLYEALNHGTGEKNTKSLITNEC